MKVAAIIVLVILVISVIIASIRNKKLVLNKGVLIVGAICFGIILIAGAASESIPIPAYQEKTPKIQDAPYMLPTPSRLYYVATWKDSKGFLTLTNYFYYDKKRWTNSDTPLPFDKSIPEFKKLAIIKRDVTRSG